MNRDRPAWLRIPKAFDEDLGGYLLSVPERVLRSASAVAGGILREIGDATLPAPVRRTRVYRSMVGATLRFLIEQVGEVDGAYPPEGRLARDFVIRRTAGNGIEFAGVVAFHASPVWVFAVLADLSGAGRHLVREIAGSLQEEGLLPPGGSFETVDQILDGLERTSGRLAEAVNTPPLDIAGLRREWSAIQRDAASIAPSSLPSLDRVRSAWSDLRREAASQKHSQFEVSLADGPLRGKPPSSQCDPLVSRYPHGRPADRRPVLAGAPGPLSGHLA